MLPVNSILKLPPELYVEIFNTTCRSQWDIFHDTDTDIGPKQDLAVLVPFRLCGVCRHWREIIMSSPVLWSDITIGLFSSTLDDIITVFEMYLGRSGECLLTIKLSVEDEDDEWCQSVPNRLIQLLASSAFRWRAINMTVPDSWLYALFKLEPVFHNLKTVRMLLVDDAGFAHPQKITFDLFKNTAPVLENLYMYRYYPRMVEAPWKQLTRLSIESVDIKECFQVLEKTTKLTCFKVYNIWSRVEGIGIHPRNASANLHFSSQVSCVFLCFRVSGNTETRQHGKYVTITLEVNNNQPLDICVSQRKGRSCRVSQFLVFPHVFLCFWCCATRGN